MPIGTPTLVATANNALLGTATTLTSSVPVSALIVVFLVDPDHNGFAVDASITDSAGNVYLRAITTPVGGGSSGNGLFYCQNAKALPIGGTFTVTGLAGQAHYSGGMAYVTGANGGLDAVNAVVTTAATSLTVPAVPILLTDASNTIILTDPNTGAELTPVPAIGPLSNEVIFGVMNSNNGISGATDGNGFTSLSRSVVNTDFAYLVVGSTPTLVSYEVGTFASGNPLGCVATFMLGDVPYQSSRLLFC